MSMHMNDEKGTKRGSSYNWRRSTANPQELLLRLIEEADGEPNKEAIFEQWRKLISKDDALQRAVDSYYFVNMYNYYVARSRSKNGKKRLAADKDVDHEKIAQEVRERVAQIGLMYLLLPNGKFLKDATFAECKQAGGIFFAVAKLGQANEIVGAKLTEKQLKSIIKS